MFGDYEDDEGEGPDYEVPCVWCWVAAALACLALGFVMLGIRP